MIKLVLFAFCLLIMQTVLTYLQSVNYYKRLNLLKTKGIIGIGNRKGRIAAGSILIMVSNKDGIIVDCEEMKGRTVFSRFKKANQYVGMSVCALKTFHQKNKKYKKSSMAIAIQSIEEQLIN
ncbi:transcriptional regulator GutM [Clostridium psychrophilum]|uniref:transcriptional regulator GutM n=1 Tax=Clostridium psychrophilum TaxID=132926 RepID=UPI001C0B8F75|nr:transcriptional regulator GutM [Clostridium psychrophilum]MBU3179803.1 transcriptional regulator GutM [Clostridium psychrophilum]